jgi:hypothetical protein
MNFVEFFYINISLFKWMLILNIYMKCLRTDCGGEFTSQEFNNFCKENGIKKQVTTAYTP